MRARENLRQTLLYLSQSALGVLQSDNASLQLSEIEVDLFDFQGGDLAAYAGPFLPGTDADWAAAVRSDLEQAFVQRLIAAAHAALDEDPTQAASLAQRAIQVDPYLERPRRLRWQALERMGERAVAAAERTQYAEFIRAEVGIEVGSSGEGVPVAPSLTPAERLFREVALAPEAFEHGRLLAAAERLKEGIRVVGPDHPYSILAWIALARVQFEVGDTAGAAESIREGRAVALTAEQSYELSSIAARVQARLGNLEESEREAARAGQSRLPEIQMEVHLLLGYLSWAKEEYDAGIDRTDRAITLANKTGAEKVRIRALRAKASGLFRVGRHADAETCLKDGIEAASDIERADLVAAMASDLGRLRESLGDLTSAHATYRQAVKALEGTDFRVQYAQAVTYLGDLEQRLQNFSEARRLHAIGVATRRMGGDSVGLGTSYRGLGKAQVGLGEYRDAIDSLKQSLRYFRMFQEQGSKGSARIPLAQALLASGEKAEAHRQATQGALELEGLGEQDILIRYNDPELLPAAVNLLIQRASA